MVRNLIRCSLSVAVALSCLMGQDAVGDDAAMTQRERDLLIRLESMMERLEGVENELEALKAEKQQSSESGDVADPDTKIREAAMEERIAQLEQDRRDNLKTFWKEGLKIESQDGAFKLQLGGRVWADYSWYHQDEALKNAVFDEQDGGQIRMARLDLRGDIYKDLFYRLEYEFAGNNGPGGFTDTYVGLRNIPYVGTLTVGHFKEPFSLEELTSDNFTTFMERGQPNGLSPARNLGIQLSNAYLGEPKKERLTYAVGVFKNTDNWPSANDADEDQGASVTGRLTALPWYKYSGEQLLHVGLSYSHRNPDGATINRYQLQPSPENRFTQFRWLNSEGFAGFRLQDARTDNVDLFGLESALVYGPFSLQGEYMLSKNETTFGGDLDFDGYYIQASYFLTGEYRAYKNANGIFDRIKPKQNFAWGKGIGAWEVAARFSSLDLNDGGVRGGEADNITLGVNWYLNPNMRWMLNYTMADIEHDLYDGDLEILQMRFQVDF